jgi:hypothetical protein
MNKQERNKRDKINCKNKPEIANVKGRVCE